MEILFEQYGDAILALIAGLAVIGMFVQILEAASAF